MVIKLELPTEIEAGLLSQARKRGLSPEAYATEVLSIWGINHFADAAELDPAEWMQEYEAWTHSHDDDTFPILSNEAISRNSIYD